MEKSAFVVLALVFVFAFTPLMAQTTLWTGTDAMVLDALWAQLLSLRLECGVLLEEGFGLRLVTCWDKSLASMDVSALELGLFLDYHPFDDGFFLSMGVAQGAFFFGRDRPETDKCFLNEIALGYTWRFTRHWFVEPKLQIRDPSGVFAAETASLRDAFGTYPMVRFSLTFGYALVLPERKGKGRIADDKEEVVVQ